MDDDSRAVPAVDGDARIAARLVLLAIGQDAVEVRRRALRDMPSLEALADGRTLVATILTWRNARDLRPELREWLDQLASEYEAARANAAETVRSIEALSESAPEWPTASTCVFFTTRNASCSGSVTPSAVRWSSPAITTCWRANAVSRAWSRSRRAIVPVEHWFALGRPWSYTSAGQTLLSWSGTMFEYLMPLLFTRTFSNSMLEHACDDAVRRQMEYGNANQMPWGVSESAYSALDVHQIYQYRPFGVPALALNPGLENRLVVSPYSTALSLLVDPATAVTNLARLHHLGMEGPMGFYESIDFSRESTEGGARGVIIYCYMAHHQGMSLAALDNFLHRDAMQRRFHRDLRVRAVETLLFEGIPISREPIIENKPRRVPIRSIHEEEAVDRVWTEETAVPRVHLHGNGRYALMITNSGGGYSRWNEFDVTRWRSDSTLDPWGSFVYIRDLKSDEIWAATHKPLGQRIRRDHCSFRA